MTIKKDILKLIQENNGDWGWYQLDRALAIEGIVAVHLPTIVSELKKDGLLDFDGDPQKASTRYRITEAGSRHLSILL
jgi:hypothetical protein